MRGFYLSAKNWILFLADVFVADLVYVLPNLIRWLYRRGFGSSISKYYLSTGAHLYHHRSVKVSDGPAALLLHGDFGHPFATLSLADALCEQGINVFSLYVQYKDVNPELHRQAIVAAIDRMIEIVGDREVVLVGHSRGAIEAAYVAYVQQASRIKGVVCIAGRLRINENSDLPCRAALRPTVAAIGEHLKKMPVSPTLLQIVATYDQVIDSSVSSISSHNRLEIKTGHTRILFQPQTVASILSFLHSVNKETNASLI